MVDSTSCARLPRRSSNCHGDLVKDVFGRIHEPSDRLSRLLTCAWLRLVWAELGKLSRRAVVLAEQFADGKATENQRKARFALLNRLDTRRQTRPDFNDVDAALHCLFPDSFAQYIVLWDILSWNRPGRGPLLDRDTLGNVIDDLFPCRVIALPTVSPMVVELAQQAYEDHHPYLNPVRVSVLADALEDEGVTGELFDHLRGPSRHHRGCLAIDLLSGVSR